MDPGPGPVVGPMSVICISDLKIRPPVGPTDWCLEAYDPPKRVNPEQRFFASKARWFCMTHERDVESAYLQLGLQLGLVKLYYKGRQIKSVQEFKAISKYTVPWKYIAADRDTGWAGLLYSPSSRAKVRTKKCMSLEECAVEAYIYKRPTKYIPQILLGALKRYHGVNTIDYIAAIINRDLRKVCAPHKECAAHIHDGLVMSGGPGPRLPFKHKLEERRGWSWAGIVAPGDPPRFWGFLPNRARDLLRINEALTKSKSPEEVMERIGDLSLWPGIFDPDKNRDEPGGLVDLELLVSREIDMGLENILYVVL